MTKQRKQYPSQARLRELFDYDVVNGDILHKGSRDSAVRYWSKGGKRGVFARIDVDGDSLSAARVAYIYQHGDIPSGKRIILINGDKKDLCPSNLQMTSYGQTSASGFNRNAARKVKYKGVCFVNGRYQARVRVDGKTKSLGCFRTPEEAAAAYNEAALSVFGVYAHLNDIPDPIGKGDVF